MRQLSIRCPGYQKRPIKMARAGTYVGRLPLYGLGKCGHCGRWFALAPKKQTLVLHRTAIQKGDR